MSSTKAILVAQHQPLIDQFVREENDNWVPRNGCDQVDQVLKLQTLELEVPLRRIYHKIDF